MSTESAVSTTSDDQRLDNVMAILDKDPSLHDDQPNTDGNATDPSAKGNTEQPGKDAIGEDQDKTKDVTGKEPLTPAAIEAPTSWPKESKELWSSIPTWMQEQVVARENEREAYFGERSRTIAAKEKDITDLQVRTTQAQNMHMAELQRLNQIASQLMPAKFADIKSEADYLKLKSENPARASEYEAFTQILTNANRQAQAAQQQQFEAHIAKEYAILQSKYPEFQDPVKAVALLDDVRKAAVEYYGFSPQEVEVVADHRHVPIIRDAIAWRQHTAALKAAQGKRVAPNAPSPKLGQNGSGTGASVTGEQKQKVLNRAKQAGSMRDQAEILAGLL